METHDRIGPAVPARRRFPPGYWMTCPGAILVLICFFLPWVVVRDGSGEPPRDVNGWMILKGNSSFLIELVRSPTWDRHLRLGLVILLAVLVVVLTLVAAVRHRLPRPHSWIVPLVGALALFFICFEMIRLKREFGYHFIEWRGGQFGTIAGLLLVTVGGTLNWLMELWGPLNHRLKPVAETRSEPGTRNRSADDASDRET